MTMPAGRCFRCGIDVAEAGHACLDCVAADRVFTNLLRPTARPVRAVKMRPADCPAPSRSGYDRHVRRGELACQACSELKHRNRPRKDAA